MKKILIVWIIVVLILVGGLTYIGLNLKNKNGPYYDLEEKLTEAAKVYFGQYPGLFPANETSASSQKLIETGFLEDLKFNEEECKGYVVVKKKVSEFYDYIPYLKCSGYTTKKYDAAKEEISV